MHIDLCPTADSVENFDLGSSTAIVIDVLRATSCIVTALAQGCKSVIPVYTPDDAFKLKRQLTGNVILGGERKSVKIPGFDLGNSPLEYLKTSLESKKLIITTTNGTKAIKNASSAKNLFVASIINAKATANRALILNQPTVLVCAGTKDKFSLDDILAAGLIVDELIGLSPSLKLTDLALTAQSMYKNFAPSILAGLKKSFHGKELVAMGLEKDLVFCCQENKYSLIAEYLNKEISVVS